MPVFPWMKREGSEHQLEISLPDAEQKKLDAAMAASAELPAIKEKLGALDKINEFITAFQADKAKETAAAAARQRAESQAATDDEFDTLMLTDPKKAMELAQKPTQIALLKVNANNIRREVFENQDKYKYYSGSIKEEVDRMLASQSLDFQQHPANIENCYLTVVGRHHDEIVDGKIKSRFAGSDSSSRGTSTGSAGDTGSGRDNVRTITDDVKKLAKSFGMKPEEYAKMLDEEGIGYA